MKSMWKFVSSSCEERKTGSDSFLFASSLRFPFALRLFPYAFFLGVTSLPFSCLPLPLQSITFLPFASFPSLSSPSSLNQLLLLRCSLVNAFFSFSLIIFPLFPPSYLSSLSPFSSEYASSFLKHHYLLKLRRLQPEAWWQFRSRRQIRKQTRKFLFGILEHRCLFRVLVHRDLHLRKQKKNKTKKQQTIIKNTTEKGNLSMLFLPFSEQMLRSVTKKNLRSEFLEWFPCQQLLKKGRIFSSDDGVIG